MDLVRVPAGVPGDGSFLESLERGNILLFPETPFPIESEDRAALLGAGQADGNFHKNIAYRPHTGLLTGLGKTNVGEGDRIRQAMERYSRQAIRFMENFLSRYKHGWRTDYASFRSIEEEGRTLPLKKRNDLIHTDAFPTRPTNGGLILRLFTNINPQKTRDWMTSDPFAILAPQHAELAGLRKSDSLFRAAKRVIFKVARAAGLPAIDRSPYDEFMLALHDYLKTNETFQRDCPKFRFQFPPNTTWMVFTDVVPHAVLAGRYALEQTMIISRESLIHRECAPASILETISGRKLTY